MYQVKNCFLVEVDFVENQDSILRKNKNIFVDIPFGISETSLTNHAAAIAGSVNKKQKKETVHNAKYPNLSLAY